MAKKRTRKQKEAARHQFIVYQAPTSPEAKRDSPEPVVKGQFKKEAKIPKRQNVREKKPRDTAKLDGLASIKRDLIKSLLAASLILSLEIMLYLALR